MKSSHSQDNDLCLSEPIPSLPTPAPRHMHTGDAPGLRGGDDRVIRGCLGQPGARGWEGTATRTRRQHTQSLRGTLRGSLDLWLCGWGLVGGRQRTWNSQDPSPAGRGLAPQPSQRPCPAAAHAGVTATPERSRELRRTRQEADLALQACVCVSGGAEFCATKRITGQGALARCDPAFEIKIM